MSNDIPKVEKDTFVAQTNKIIKALKTKAKIYDFSDWKQIVLAARNGDAASIPNGQVFTVPHAVYGNIDFVVRRKNVDKVAGEQNRPTVTFQSKYLLSPNANSSASTFQYDRPEAFVSVSTEIPANTVCKFTVVAYDHWTAGAKHFTATSAIPAGSKLCISGYAYQSDLTSQKVNVYANAKATSPSAQYTIESGEGGATVDLGTWNSGSCNHVHRISYGSNNDAQANITQWLNGDSGPSYMDSIFVPKTDFDMMCTSFTSLKGFLGGFSDEFRSCLGLCAVHDITNTAFETGYTTNSDYTHNAYFWLPSRKEIYGSNETSSEDSEIQFPYYANIGTTNADKLMYAKGASSPTTYWLRTPVASHAYTVRICYAGSGGALNVINAGGSYGVAPLGILT